MPRDQRILFLVSTLLCFLNPFAIADDGLEPITVAGATLRAGFVPDRPEYVLGLPPRMKFTVRNQGPREIQFNFGGDYRGVGRHDRFKITATNDAGELMIDPHGNGGNFGGLMMPKAVKPGESFVEPIDLLAFRTMDKPGTYHIACGFDLERFDAAKTEILATVSSAFDLVVLPRTPQRVSELLDKLAAEVRALPADQREQLLGDMVEFGADDAAPRLIALVSDQPIEARGVIFNALAKTPGTAATESLLAALKDPDPRVRAMVAQSLNARNLPEVVDALLAAAADESLAVQSAAIVSLGRLKSERAMPLFVQSLHSQSVELQDAAVAALVACGNAEAIATLERHVVTNDIRLRFRIGRALAEELRRPASASWFVPILLTRDMSREWYDSLSQVRMFTGAQAVPTLLGCVDFAQPWSSRNWWLLEAVKVSQDAPKFDYIYDPNREGTPEELEKNRSTLVALRPRAMVFTAADAQLAQRPRVRVRPLQCDPPIDFTPKIRSTGGDHDELSCGFYSGRIHRTGSNYQYTPNEQYQPLYDRAEKLKNVIAKPDAHAALNLSPQQNDSFKKLTPPGQFDEPIEWHVLHSRYIEAPAGPVREQAEAELLDAIQAHVQNYHRGVRGFVTEAEKLLSAEQLKQL